MTRSDSFDSLDGIAIIGVACRFPGAKDANEFWRNLRDGVESISFFSDQELAAEGISPALLADPDYVKAGAVLEGIKLFDAGFFGYSPREAELIDPQQRFLLECAWTALEVAGYSPESYSGQIGVYAGSRINEYLLKNLYPDGERLGLRNRAKPLALGDDDYLASRVSYKLNLWGPSLKIQAACSTSLVAVHLASQALLNGECDMAIAGGVALRVPEKTGYFYEEGSVLSPDGHCRSFDARANGTVFGGGVGLVVLKRLADAVKDRDHIDAIIKGSAINNDGALKIGFTAPSAEGQAQVIAEALDIASVDPETVSYIEAHGTATSLGDPIEIAALTQAFRAGTRKKIFCAIGSVKSNIGHASAAAGVAGIIKTTLALKHKLLPPSLHFEQANPKIDFANSPFYVNTKLSEWKSAATPRRAGVSSFGVGGTNAHAILEEAPAVEASGPSRPWQLILLSAKSATALEAATTNLADHLKQHADIDLGDVAFTLQVGRKSFNHRRALVCQDLADVVQTIGSRDPTRIATWASEMSDGTAAFMFPGQGSQYVNMGRDLYQTEPMFRAQVDRCAEILLPKLGLDLRHTLYASEARADEASKRLNRTLIAQPALFTIEYALAKLLIGWGIEPKAMIGHSVGEYVAACLAGVFTLEDGLGLIAARGRLMDGLPGGAMMAVPLPLADVKPFLSGTIELAAHNGPSLCVLAGPEESLQALDRRMKELNIDCRRLHTSHAFHSRMMEPVLQAFTDEVDKIDLKPPTMPYISNVSGNWITEAEATDANYWAKQLRQTVRFSAGLAKLLETFNGTLLEIGPGHSLSTSAIQHKRKDQTILRTMRRPQEHDADLAFLLRTLGRLWLAGVRLDWVGFYGTERRHRLPLPTYPFERQRYWVEAPLESGALQARAGARVKKLDIADWFYVPSWKRSVSPQILQGESLAQHRRSWLVFVDDCDLGVRLAERLEASGQNVIRVEPGVIFSRIDQNRYAINPRSQSDYFDLIKSLAGGRNVPDRIVHLWSVTRNDTAVTIEAFDAAQPLGFYSLLYLAQALEKHGVVTPLRIEFISNHLQEIGDGDRLRPETATALGPCKVIPQEYTHINCRNIDVVLPGITERGEDALVEQLLKEFASQPVDRAIAYRGKHRWVQVFEPARLTVSDGSPRLRTGGVYLITGGLGHIGLLLAKYLAITAKAKLVLTGRSVPPEREHWDEYLRDHAEDDLVVERIRQVKALENLGAEVLVAGADVSALEQMQAVIAQATRRFGTLHGVIHAAGILGEKLMMPVQETSPDGCRAQFGAKVHGLMVLDQLLCGKELDFCIVTSSLSSVLGGIGFSTYAAANLFTDAFAHHHAQTGGLRWTSINFGRWEFTVEAQGRTNFAAAAASAAMTAEEGVEAFKRILSADPATQIIVSTRDLTARIDEWKNPEISRSADQSPSAEPAIRAAISSGYTRPNLANTYVAPTNDLQRTIAAIWQEQLGIGQIGLHDNFFELGGHSLLATQIISRIRNAFSIEVPLRRVFESQTVAEMAAIVTEIQVQRTSEAELAQMMREVEAMTEEEVQQGTDEPYSTIAEE
ncbi:MAG: SDR family NAD(P)-dependent oxidoreductase [Candidatus Binatia bacterium]